MKNKKSSKTNSKVNSKTNSKENAKAVNKLTKKANNKKIGLWLDHKSATIVNFVNEAPVISKIESELEPVRHSTGGSRGALPYTFDGGGAEGRIMERRNHDLSKYYHKIIKAVSSAGWIYIFGPTHARDELMHEIQRAKVKADLDVESSDKLTQRQIVAKVKKHFNMESPRKINGN